MIHNTSTNVFGRINANIIPTATQNRANPTTRFIPATLASVFYIICAYFCKNA